MTLAKSMRSSKDSYSMRWDAFEFPVIPLNEDDGGILINDESIIVDPVIPQFHDYSIELLRLIVRSSINVI